MEVVQSQPEVASRAKGPVILLLIGLFKFVKGGLLVTAGFGALRLLHSDVPSTVNEWLNFLRLDPENRLIHRLVAPLLSISPSELRVASVGTFVYAALLLTEGVGLLLRKAWAEYFTIIVTAGLIPLELYEIFRHVTALKIGVLVVNVAIVWYLVWFVRRERRKHA